MKSLKVLVTGACGYTSRSVMRSLSISKEFKNSTFIGTDICNNLYGIYEGLYKRIYRVPHCSDTNYRKVINKILLKEKIDVALVIPELEVLHWSENPFKVKCLLPPPLFSKTVISKKKLYDSLKDTNLIPKYQIVDRKQILKRQFSISIPYPVWIRETLAGTTSGRGSFLAKSNEELKAWVLINKQIKTFMVSEYLPGRNYACYLLFKQGRLLKMGLVERLEYIMSKVSISGITGNTSIIKFRKRKSVSLTAIKAVEKICQLAGEEMQGMVVIDLKENRVGRPLITEINIRHAALTSIFAQAGFNFSEFHLLCALGRNKELSPLLEKRYPKNNLVLREIDGKPIYVKKYKPLKIGKFL